MTSLTIRVPSSKSETQRALVLAALASEPTRVARPLHCDDSSHLRRALSTLGARFTELEDGDLVVEPAELPLRSSDEPIHCGNAGTVMRFCAPLALLCHGVLHLDGDDRMRRRPVGPLIDALARMGVDAVYGGIEGCPPVRLAKAALPPRRVSVDASLSSQFASGVLLAATRLKGGLELELTGEVVSRPYIEMTRVMMQRQGCAVEWLDDRKLAVSEGRPRGGLIEVDGDWSSAAFLLVAGRLAEVDLRIEGLSDADASVQGDAVVSSLLAKLDSAKPGSIDLTAVPDLIAPLAVAALFRAAPTRFRGAAHTRIKESDRVAVLARELTKLGARVTPHVDGLDVEPFAASAPPSVVLDPDDDHRMAMAFGLVSLRIPGITVANSECVTKSFPTFWHELERIGRFRLDAR